MQRRSFGVSDVGLHREHNEDSFLSDDALGLYVVADGVGGHAKGEIASAQSVEEVYGFVSRSRGTIDRFIRTQNDRDIFAVKRMLESAVQAACYMVFGLAEQDPNRKGMSTTMSVLLIAEGLGVIAQVGDSRVYRLRNGVTEQLTEDHTLINYKLKHGLITPEEAAKSPGKNVITRAVGHKDYVQVDTMEFDVKVGDRYLLCSDGLHGYLQDDELPTLLNDGSIEQLAGKLVMLANDRGGKDNITVLVVEVVPSA